MPFQTALASFRFESSAIFASFAVSALKVAESIDLIHSDRGYIDSADSHIFIPCFIADCTVTRIFRDPGNLDPGPWDSQFIPDLIRIPVFEGNVHMPGGSDAGCTNR